MDVVEFFSTAGPLAKTVPGYEERAGQIELACAVEQAISSESVLLAEAPTGTGKGHGYLVPVVLSGKRAIVVTANIALQEQLARKDLPALERAVGKLSWAVLKGTSNYLCQLGLSRAERDPPIDPDRLLQRVKRWAPRTRTGDLGELDFELSPSVRRAVSTDSDSCLGRRCAHYETCHVYDARRAAANAQIIVTNYHLLFADLAVRTATDGGVKILPDVDVLIMDEAHNASSIARDCVGWRATAFMVSWIARHLSGGRREAGPAPRLGRELQDAGENLFDEIDRVSGKEGYVEAGKLDVDPSRVIDFLGQAADVLASVSRRGKDDDTALTMMQAGKRATELAYQLSQFFAQGAQRLEGWAYWAERSGKRAELRAAPLDVGPTFQQLFERFKSVVGVSATLRDSSSFGLVERELGIARESGDRLTVASPFDFSETALLCPATLMPEPTDARYRQRMIDLLEATVREAGGRTLALFTSYAALDQAYGRLVETAFDPEIRILRQGDYPRTELLRIFAEDETSVLLGTDSFWEGVDIPGRSLSVVFVDRLPFPRPDDPIVSKLIELDGRKGYSTHAIGRAVIRFCQGFGRLVRRRGDFGVVVCADPRLLTGNYASRFLKRLPEGLQGTTGFRDVNWAAIRGES